MSKIAVVFWSGTGNTEKMAQAVAEGAKSAGAEVDVFEVDKFDVGKMSDYAAFLFGCPAMGDEVLEEDSFEPFFTDAEGHLENIPVGLFGSYGWGGGAWMDAWTDRTKDAKADFVGNVIAENDPDDDAIENCKKLGKDVAEKVA